MTFLICRRPSPHLLGHHQVAGAARVECPKGRRVERGLRPAGLVGGSVEVTLDGRQDFRFLGEDSEVGGEGGVLSALGRVTEMESEGRLPVAPASQPEWCTRADGSWADGS